MKGFKYSLDSFLIRKTINKEEMLDEDGEIELAAYQVEEFIDYSTNLINSKGHNNCIETEISDVLIEVEETHYTRAPWNGDNEAVPSTDELNASKAEHKGYFFIRIKDIHGLEGEFPFSKKQGKPESVYTLKVLVEHKPNLINICHFELVCYSNLLPKNGKFERIKRKVPIKEKSSREKIVHIIRDRMIDICSITLE